MLRQIELRRSHCRSALAEVASFFCICLLFFTFCQASLAQADLIDDARLADHHKDYVHALDLWKQLDQQGNIEARFMLGSMFLHGIGTKPRVADGIDMIRSAAQSGYGEAQYTLSGLYYEGKYLPRDTQESEHWLQAAAESGYAPAQITFSMHLSLSRNSTDRIAALKWIYLALQAIDERDPEYGLAAAQRGILMSNLTTDEIAQATKAAQEWRQSRDQDN
jgi:TPR repeat protein